MALDIMIMIEQAEAAAEEKKAAASAAGKQNIAEAKADGLSAVEMAKLEAVREAAAYAALRDLDAQKEIEVIKSDADREKELIKNSAKLKLEEAAALITERIVSR